MKFICQNCNTLFIFDEKQDVYISDYSIIIKNEKVTERMTIVDCPRCKYNNIIDCKILGGVN